MPVVSPADHDRPGGGTGGDPLPNAQRTAGPATAAERGEPAPPPPQFKDGRMAAARVQPQPQPDPVVTHPVTRQLPVRDVSPDQEPDDDRSQDEQDKKGDDVTQSEDGGGPHDAPPRAARTRGRRADRAAPTLSPTSGARSLAILETFAGSMPARSP